MSADTQSLEYLETQTCYSYGGINCVLHGCMFECVLREAKKRAIIAEEKKGRVFSEQERNQILSCKSN